GSGLPYHGVAIANVIALAGDPVRILPPEEAEDLIQSGKAKAEAICSTSGKSSTLFGKQTLAEVGEELLNFCHPEHAVRLNEQLLLAEKRLLSGDALGGLEGGSAESANNG